MYIWHYTFEPSASIFFLGIAPLILTCSLESSDGTIAYMYVGRVLIAWFNDCILGKSGQIVNPIIVTVNPVLYYSIHVCKSINCEHRKPRNSQLIDTRNYNCGIPMNMD